MRDFATRESAAITQASSPLISSSVFTSPETRNAQTFAIGITKTGQLFVAGSQTAEQSHELLRKHGEKNGNQGDYYIVPESAIMERSSPLASALGAQNADTPKCLLIDQ